MARRNAGAIEPMSDDAMVSCDAHGEAHATYVCEHLAGNPVQRWHSAAPSEDNRWPDAWCSQCNVEFLKEGEWNERNEEGLVPRILCHMCYESALARSVARLDASGESAWNELVTRSVTALSRKQALLESSMHLGQHQRWDWDQEQAQLIFSNDGTPAVICDIAFVGSISTASNTWLWSWANFSLMDAARAPMESVREFGEESDFPKLMVPKWQADEADGWEMAAVAAEVMGALGVYRAPVDRGFTFLVILHARLPQ